MFGFAQHDGAVWSKERDPASFQAGRFVTLTDLADRCHAASAGASCAAATAASVGGRDRRRARKRYNCCNQEQIFHDSLLLRFRESSAAQLARSARVFEPRRTLWERIRSAAAESAVVRFALTRLRRRLAKCGR